MDPFYPPEHNGLGGRRKRKSWWRARVGFSNTLKAARTSSFQVFDRTHGYYPTFLNYPKWMCPQYFPVLRSLIFTLQCPHVHIFLNPNIEKIVFSQKGLKCIVWLFSWLYLCHGISFHNIDRGEGALRKPAATASPRHELRKKLRRSVGGGCVFAALDTLALRPHSPNISWNSCNDERLRLIWSRGLRPLFQFLAASPTFNCRSCTVI